MTPITDIPLPPTREEESGEVRAMTPPQHGREAADKLYQYPWIIDPFNGAAVVCRIKGDMYKVADCTSSASAAAIVGAHRAALDALAVATKEKETAKQPKVDGPPTDEEQDHLTIEQEAAEFRRMHLGALVLAKTYLIIFEEMTQAAHEVLKRANFKPKHREHGRRLAAVVAMIEQEVESAREGEMG